MKTLMGVHNQIETQIRRRRNVFGRWAESEGGGKKQSGRIQNLWNHVTGRQAPAVHHPSLISNRMSADVHNLLISHCEFYLLHSFTLSPLALRKMWSTVAHQFAEHSGENRIHAEFALTAVTVELADSEPSLMRGPSEV